MFLTGFHLSKSFPEKAEAKLRFEPTVADPWQGLRAKHLYHQTNGL